MMKTEWRQRWKNCSTCNLQASFLHQPFVYTGVKKIAHIFPGLDGLADKGGTDFEYRRIDQTYTGRQGRNIDRITRTGINQNGILCQQAFGLIPAGEGVPVVRSDNQMERMLRIDLLQAVEGMDGVRRLRQMEFEIGSTELGITLYGQLYQLQPQGVGQQVLPHLERIAGSDQKPQFIQPNSSSPPNSQR